MLTYRQGHDTICTVKDGWLECPICRRNRRLMRIRPETTASALVVYCKDCRHEIIVNIEQGQRVELRCQ